MVAGLIWSHHKDAQASAELAEIAKGVEEERKIAAEARRLQEALDGFYQKLQDRFNVNILIVGDSIGEQNWTTLVVNRLHSEYRIDVNCTNISMGGNSSYAGYVRTMALDDGIDYDLAIICYGQNDAAEDFSLYYEALLRAIQAKYSKCSIISILESSQKEYTEKMQTIMMLCDHYKIPVADTIAAFKDSGVAYEELTSDGIHPNSEGQALYCETVMSVIEQHIGEPYVAAGRMALNAAVSNFDEFTYFSSEAFDRTDEVSYMLAVDAPLQAILGIDYTFESGDNKAYIYVDGQEFAAPAVTFNYDFSQRHILVFDDTCTVQHEIRLVFETEKQAKGFKGICFSW